MKAIPLIKFGIIGISFGLSLTATAKCFNFVVGQKPEGIASLRWTEPASNFCLQKVTSLGGGRYERLSFNDQDGEAFASFQVEVRTPRCRDCPSEITLVSGNVEGENFRPEEFTEVVIKMTTTVQENLGTERSTLTFEKNGEVIQHEGNNQIFNSVRPLN